MFSFNSRTREGCDGCIHRNSAAPTCFNSRTREGCDSPMMKRIPTLQTSFNSRTREGCDLAGLLGTMPACLFQFTHPGGVRRALCRTHRDTGQVSIHAPGRGATCTLRSNDSIRVFQFTHPGGVRPSRAKIAHVITYSFNSRTREGCDWPRLSSPLKHSSFQFTHPGGVRRSSISGFLTKVTVSIHAPGRGATGGE